MKISVALCTYNGERYIKEQLDSIVNQVFPVDEIVICDDKSTDNTWEILLGYKSKYPSIFKIFSNEKTLKSVKNFERAILLCTGNITFLSDQDDYWHPNKVEVFIQNFLDKPDILAFCSNGYLMNENAEILYNYFSKWDVFEKYLSVNKNIDKFNFLTQKGNFSTGATMALKTDFAQSVLPVPELQNFHHDEWLTLLATTYGKMEFIPEKLINYRVHSFQQVGGIAFPKHSKYFSEIFEYFCFNSMDDTFRSIKSRISAQVKWQNNFLIYFKSNPQQYEILKNNFTVEYNRNTDRLKSKFPIKSLLLKGFDRIMNKRQIIK